MTPSGQPSGSIFTGSQIRTRQSPLYDSVHVATATTTATLYKMFGNINGVNSIGPDITNMEKAFELAGGKSMYVRSLRCCFLAAAADIQAFVRNYTVRLIAGGITLLDAPADFWPGGAGTYGVASNGVADPRAVIGFDLDPINLTDGISFRVDLVGAAGFLTTADFFMRVYLDGRLTEPV
jgi:hypothetical protein